MIIIALTDLHGNTNYVHRISEKIASADCVIVSGDITHFGNEHDADHVLGKISRLNSNIFAVSGNCDYPGVEEYLEEKGWNNHGKVLSFKYISLLGLKGSLPCPGKTPEEYTEEEFEFYISSLRNKIDDESLKIFISHQPPYNTVTDKVFSGIHVGSTSIRKFIENIQPILVFTGHIHEGMGIDSIGTTTLINPGLFREGNYALVKITNGKITEAEIRKA